MLAMEMVARMKQRCCRGYLLSELLITIGILSLLSGWGYAKWSDLWEDYKLETAAQQVLGCIHEVQALARSNKGGSAPIVTLRIYTHPRNEYVTEYQMQRGDPRGRLPEGIRFASGQNMRLMFQQEGKIIAPLSQHERMDSAIVLINERGRQKRIVIAVQTGRVRIE